jgi:hypothetical protein
VRYMQCYSFILSLLNFTCSGFTGESSMAIVSQDQACLFVDGRYHVSASKEIDENWTLYKVGLEGVPTWSKQLEVIFFTSLKLAKPWLTLYFVSRRLCLLGQGLASTPPYSELRSSIHCEARWQRPSRKSYFWKTT